MKTNLSKYVLFFNNTVEKVNASTCKMIAKTKRCFFTIAVIGTVLFELGSVVPVFAQDGSVDPGSQNLDSSSSGVSFSSGWENGILGSGNWLGAQIVSGDRLQLVTDHVRKGQYAARIEVRPGDITASDSGERSEVYAMVNSNGTIIMEDESSGTQYYAFSVMLDSDWQAPSGGSGYWSIVFQLHGPNQYGASPMFALNAMDGYYGYLCAGDLDRNQTFVGKSLMLSDDSLNRGHWVDWVVKITYAKTATGSISIWRRNEGATQFTQVFNEDNLPTLQYKSDVNGGAVEGHYWKHGLYRPKNVSITNVLWLDGMTRGTSFDAVAAEAFPSDSIYPTATPVPTTATPIPPTTTPVPPTATPVPTQTPVPASKAVISSFTPSSYTIKPGRSLTLKITGRNFLKTDQVLWGDVLLPIRYISSRSIKVVIPFKNLSAGNVPVIVGNSSLYSDTKFYKVLSPAAKISKLSPSKLKVNTAYTLTVKGSNFLEGAVVTWNGVALNTQFVNNKTLTVSIPADMNNAVTSSSRKIKVTVVNPPPYAKKPVNNTSLRVTK